MITEHEIPIPRWDISDPFGRAAIRRARWEYKRKAAECESLHYELEQIYADRESAMARVTNLLVQTQKRLEDTTALLKRSDDGRTSIAIEKQSLSHRNAVLRDEVSMWKSEFEKLKADYDELEKEHERLIRAMTDKEEIA